MVSTDQGARLRFLEQASELLTVSSPPTSSFLRATKRNAAALQEVETNDQNVCKTCSRVLIIGWSCESVRSREHRQTRQQRLGAASTTTKCVKCLACDTENTIALQKRSKTMKRENAGIKQSKPTAALPTTTEEKKPTSTPAPSSASPSTSKKQTPETTQNKPTARRKARGKHASLQALLANKKPEAPKNSGFGLDFMDFMK